MDAWHLRRQYKRAERLLASGVFGEEEACEQMVKLPPKERGQAAADMLGLGFIHLTS